VWPFAAGGSGSGGGGSGGGDGASCRTTDGFRSVSARPVRRGLRLGFARRGAGRVDVDVFQVARGRRVVREHRVARFANLETSYVWGGGHVQDGVYFVRFSLIRGGERVDVQRIVLQRRGGRFHRLPGHHRRAACGIVRQFKLERPVFGGTRGTPLRIAYRLSRAARVGLVVLRGKRVVRRFRTRAQAAGRTYRLTLRARGLRRGRYAVRLTAVSGSRRVVATLHARRL
jgi:hypothetical protein